MRGDHEITGMIIGEAVRIHRCLGPGALEHSYTAFLDVALRRRGLAVECEVPIALEYEGMRVPIAYRLDLVVEQRIIVEVKSTEAHHPVHTKQLLTYLRHTKLRTGLLLNFGMPRLTDGIQRLVNGWEEEEGTETNPRALRGPP